MSLLPNKYVPIEFSSVGLAAQLLEAMRSNDTVSSLWDRISGDDHVRSFNRFADALTVLYAAGLIDIARGTLIRIVRKTGET
jgi:hypothetical protein